MSKTEIRLSLSQNDLFRHLFQLHHVHGGIFRRSDRRRSQLPSQTGRNARHAGMGKSISDF